MVLCLQKIKGVVGAGRGSVNILGFLLAEPYTNS